MAQHSDDPRPPASGNRQGRATRLRLERAALERFAEHGIEATTVDDIVERAGTSIRTFFYHFATKHDVVTSNISDDISRFSRLLFARHELEPVDALLAAIEADTAELELDDVALLRWEVVAREPAVGAVATELREQLRAVLLAWVASRTARDIDSIEVRSIAAALVAVRNEVIDEWARHRGDVDVAALARAGLSAVRIR